jgi:6-phosphogluconolactonase
MQSARLSLIAVAALIAACTDAAGPNGSPAIDDLNASLAGSSDSDDDSDDQATGGVFTQTNDATGNAVVAYTRRPDGSLSFLGTFPTGGRGTAPGSGLGSQGSVLLTPNNHVLLAVNAGSNEISSFAVGKAELKLASTIPSGGERPISVAATNHVAYVLNNSSSTVAGFRIGHGGTLTPVPGWTRPLSRSGANAAQVQFTRDGRFLIVVHRAAPGYDVFPVNHDGSLGSPVFSPSGAAAPFGFDITARGYLVGSEPGDNPGTDDAVSSYRLKAGGNLTPVSSGIDAGDQLAPCWVVITHDGRFAYTANSPSASISGFAIAANGALSLITPGGRTGVTGRTPVDLDVSRNSRFLYVAESGSGNVSGFAIGRDGSLSSLSNVTRPESARSRGGLAAF